MGHRASKTEEQQGQGGFYRSPSGRGKQKKNMECGNTPAASIDNHQNRLPGQDEDSKQVRNQTLQETVTGHQQNAPRKGKELESAKDQEEVIQKGINSKQSAELLQNLQKSLQMHCEGLLFFIKASTAQKGALKDVALKDNTNEMINKHVIQAKPDKLWTSFNQICCNIQAIFEHYGINPSDMNMQQLLEMVEKYKHEDKVQIQVLRDKSGDIARKVENELTVRLESRMGVKFKTCRNESEIESTKPLLVLCVAGTRIGSDATYSIQDIAREYYRNTALLIIHNKEEHSLPVKSSSDVLTDQKFEDLGGIFDFGYSTDMGIYGCKMNNRSFDDLTLFITRHAAEKS